MQLIGKSGFIDPQIAIDVANRYWRIREGQREAAQQAALTNDEGENYNRVIVSLDLGQVNDYTAIVASELVDRENDEGEVQTHHMIRLIERVKLGTSYADVASRARQIYENLDPQKRNISFVIDASGARPIIDLFRAEEIPFLPITITGGTNSRIEHGMGYVSKLELATLLQVKSAAGLIHLPKLSRYSPAIRDELRRFELNITDAGNITFGGAGRSKDDLVMALSYCLFMAERYRARGSRPRVQWI